MDENDYQTMKNMVDRGGNFTTQLAWAMYYANIDQLDRIKAAFPEIIERHRPDAPIETPPAIVARVITPGTGIWKTVDSLCKSGPS